MWSVEEAQEAPDVVIGMFLVNDTSTVVLFDSGASYSFIFAAYVGKHNLPLALLRCQMIVSSLSTNHKCTQPCYFPLLLKPAAQKERIDWNSSTRSSRLHVAPVVIPVVLWSLPLLRSAENRHSL
jgi:hypothetical protein